MLPNSLTFRLTVTSLLWVSGALLAVGVLLVLLFRAHLERRFDSELRDHIEELAAAAEIGPDGKFRLTATPSDPRFHRPFSGWYWQINEGERVIVRSRSLWHASLPIPTDPPPGGRMILRLKGPDGAPLRVMVQAITLPDSDAHFLFAISGPVQHIEQDVSRFTWQLIFTLSALALALLLAVVIQVRFGLHPLRRLRREIAAIRSGRKQRMAEDVPEEVKPVVAELNALLAHNARMLERARAQAADLAHALKNPLTVLRNEASEIAGERGRILRSQTDIIGRHVERHLSRARAAALHQAAETRAPVLPVAEDLRFTLELIYKDKALAFTMDIPRTLTFRGDPHDLEEMLGNLMDNACKWAKSHVWVQGWRAGETIHLVVEDDGPGIPEEHVTEMLRRGRRLDETVAGSGLGLDIVQDMVALYDGAFHLGRSQRNGLRAELVLPAGPEEGATAAG